MKNRIFSIIVIFSIIMSNCVNCYSSTFIDNCIVKYKVSDNSSYKEDTFINAKKDCSEYKDKSGEKLSYPYIKRILDSDDEISEEEYFIYDYNDIFDYGYEVYAYGIPAIKFDEFIKNPSKEFLGNNYMTMYARNAKTGEELIDIVNDTPMKYTKNNNKAFPNGTMMRGVDFYFGGATIGPLNYNLIGPNRNLADFLKSKNISENIVYSCVVYPYDEWVYGLELVPLIWVKTDKSDYFVSNYSRKERADNESLNDYYSNNLIYAISELSEPKLYTLDNAIAEFSLKEGKLFIDNNETDVDVKFYNNTAIIPLRAYAEKLGYNVIWNSNGTVGLVKDNTYLNIDSTIEKSLWNLWLIDGNNHRNSILSTEKYNNSIYFDNGMFFVTNEAIKEIGNYGGYNVDIHSKSDSVYVKIRNK
ncbi:MAG: stalk domain-containing protein [Lachnospirales bacterium]